MISRRSFIKRMAGAFAGAVALPNLSVPNIETPVRVEPTGFRVNDALFRTVTAGEYIEAGQFVYLDERGMARPIADTRTQTPIGVAITRDTVMVYGTTSVISTVKSGR
jgi:hypothetical protein